MWIRNYKLYNALLVNCDYKARAGHDVFFGHPSQKPIKLIKKIILDFTKEGQTIFDPFLGSGTTAIAAKQLGRNYIGIEISEKYCKIANQRLRQDILL